MVSVVRPKSEALPKEFLTVGYNGLHPVERGLQYLDKMFSLAHPDLIYHYLKSNIGILIEFRVRGIAQDYLALFKNPISPNVNPVIRNMPGPVSGSRLSKMLPDIESAKHGCKCQQQPVLVSNVQSMGPQERSVPSAVWLDTKDVILSLLPHSLYFSKKSGPLFFGLRPMFTNRGFCSTANVAPIMKNEGARKMIQCTPKVLKNISRSQSTVGRNLRNLRSAVKALSGLRIALYPDRIGMRLDRINQNLQIVDMFLGPLDF